MDDVLGTALARLDRLIEREILRLRARRRGKSAGEQNDGQPASRGRKPHRVFFRSCHPDQSCGSAKVHTEPPSGTCDSRARPAVP